jgi:hypothetical protein
MTQYDFMVTNDLNAELSAMQQIASVLIRLDPAARSRALHWIQERFQDDVDHSVAPAPSARLALAITTDAPSVSAPELSADEALSVAALDDFFDARPKTPAPPVTGLLHEFATEFRDIAREWDNPRHVLPAAS